MACEVWCQKTEKSKHPSPFTGVSVTAFQYVWCKSKILLLHFSKHLSSSILHPWKGPFEDPSFTQHRRLDLLGQGLDSFMYADRVPNKPGSERTFLKWKEMACEVWCQKTEKSKHPSLTDGLFRTVFRGALCDIYMPSTKAYHQNSSIW
jgi:hypothetical protein